MDPVIRFPDGREVRRSVIYSDRSSLEKYLRPYRGNTHSILCMCRTDGIRVGVKDRSDTRTCFLYELHRGDTYRHALGCPQRNNAKSSGSGSDTLPAVEVDVDGQIHVHLACPLYRLLPRKGDPSSSVVHNGGGDTSDSARGRLLTLLEVLWSQAELNVWRPWFAKSRKYDVVQRRLIEAASRVRLGKTQELVDLLYIPPRFSDHRKDQINKARDTFVEKLAERDGKARYGFLGGIFNEITKMESGGVTLTIKHNSQRLWLVDDAWERYHASWFTGIEPGAPIFLLMRVERHEGKMRPWLGIEDMAAMQLTDDRSFMPVDSSHERRLAKKLIDSGRLFRKPLAVEMGDDPTLPDFALEDRDEPVYLEVLGLMADGDYRARVAEKEKIYAAERQAVWWWNTQADKDIPALPAAAVKYALSTSST